MPAPILVLGGGEDNHREKAAPTDDTRSVRVGASNVELFGTRLAAGDRILADFSIPAARGSSDPLTGERLRRGLVIMTTLPNIHKNACAAQIVLTEHLARTQLPAPLVVHVASDEPEGWSEVDEFHGDVCAAGYSLHGSSDADTFRRTFGVGVRGSDRIARGLFAFLRGVVLAANVPEDQMRTPDVEGFIRRTRALVDLIGNPEPR